MQVLQNWYDKIEHGERKIKLEINVYLGRSRTVVLIEFYFMFPIDSSRSSVYEIVAFLKVILIKDTFESINNSLYIKIID